MSPHMPDRPEMTEVTEDVFEEFVSAYPRPLERHVCGGDQPAIVHFVDRSCGAWPANVVGCYFVDWFPSRRAGLASAEERSGFRVRRPAGRRGF